MQIRSRKITIRRRLRELIAVIGDRSFVCSRCGHEQSVEADSDGSIKYRDSYPDRSRLAYGTDPEAPDLDPKSANWR